jgi:TRAP-type C4-dicarboxylate transport system substrate-binding protein
MRPVFRLAVVPLLLGWCCASAAEPYRLRFHHMLPPAAPAHWSMIEPWVEKVERESGGRMVISIYPAMQLGGQSPMLLNQVRDGVVDIVWTLSGYTPGRFPSLEVFEMPGLNAHPAIMNLAIAEFVERRPEEFADYKIIAAFVHAGQALHSKVPVRSPEDFAGMKIRIPSRLSGWVVEAMGASPVGTPAAKIPELLSKGVVDAAFIPFEVVQALKVHELVDYHVVLDLPGSDRFHTQIFIMAMNWDSYQALPAELQDVIDRNSGANIATWLADIWMGNEQPGKELAAASGEVIRMNREDSRRLVETLESRVLERWIRSAARHGIDGRALLAEARALLAKYGSRHVD